VGPVKVVFLLFDALLTEVFEDIVFNPAKIFQETCTV
jgi:hypothetical protein